MEDVLLLEGLIKKRQEAYSEVYRKYAKLLYAKAYQILQNRQEAEELVQDFFVNHVLRFSKWGQVVNLKYYLQKGIHNLCIIYLDKQKRIKRNQLQFFREEHAAFPNSGEPVTYQPAIEEYEKSLLDKILSSLSDQQQTAMRLAHIEKCCYKEIASIMKVSRNTVKTHLRLARKNIEKYQAYLQTILQVALVIVFTGSFDL
ncbi:RNA polymerase sigma factor [Chitinophaga lutea]|uniref:RNA polymerase sigma factor n=1 Tax=Chitinophaga lutea TaxID=2488634 RepID=A0A3N4PT88_9BACT|nr:RNA polymerase sigma factor [Chitinophaga lutea]RPE12043.1 RNA polymerase sigma factor [Chitinophaga lutea]